MSDEQHEAFLKRLEYSREAVFAVARWQHEMRDRRVEIPPLRFAPTRAEADQYGDDGDLFLLVRHPIEVKRLIGKTFTCAGDWPFKEVFVDREERVKAAKGRMLAYYTVSDDLKYVAIIPGTTHEAWYPVTHLNRITGNVVRTTACPTHLAIFEPMTPAAQRMVVRIRSDAPEDVVAQFAGVLINQ